MKKLIVISFLLIGFILPTSLFAVTAEMVEEWAVRYNGPANLNDVAGGFDRVHIIAMDALGNVYIAGWSYGSGTGRDIVTIKYAPSGDELWAARYNGPGNGWDIPRALAVDSSGNILVAGYTYVDSDRHNDIVAIKYDGTTGEKLWESTYNCPGNDVGRDIVVDSSDNAYITGQSGGDGIVVAFDPEGNVLWATRYDRGRLEYFWAIAKGSGIVYAVGQSDRSGTGWGGTIAAYNATTGNEIWVAYVDSNANSYDYFYDVKVDSSGNVYATGLGTLMGRGNDIAIAKYDSEGNRLWVNWYNGGGYDIAFVLDLDMSGNPIVTGMSKDIGTGYDYATIKYNATTGQELWVATYDGVGGYDKAHAIAVDSSGNAYVTGLSYGSETGNDIVTVKYDGATGQELWVARWNGPANLNEVAYAIAVDSSGNAYVTGGSQSIDTGWDFITIKYPIPNTPTGDDVVISSDQFTITFKTVTSGGNTWVNVTEHGPHSPPYTPVPVATFYEIETTALYDGWIQICIHYNDTNVPPPKEEDLRLRQYDEVENAWLDITTSLDTETNWICGETTHLSYFAVMLPMANVDIEPDTMNLKSKGKYVTCYIELPAEYDVNDIDVTTVTIESGTSSVSVETTPTQVGDFDSDGVQDLMVKFDRASVYEMLSLGSVQLTVRGSFTSGFHFEGSNIVNVIDRGNEHIDEGDPSSVKY